jgi:hypothetical protein
MTLTRMLTIPVLTCATIQSLASFSDTYLTDTASTAKDLETLPSVAAEKRQLH